MSAAENITETYYKNSLEVYSLTVRTYLFVYFVRYFVNLPTTQDEFRLLDILFICIDCLVIRCCITSNLKCHNLYLHVFLYVTVEAGTVVRGNDELERNIVVVETVAVSKGLSPEVITVLLDLALSLNAGNIIRRTYTDFFSYLYLFNMINMKRNPS